ncbi:IclR family transcriptional regulator domain-containing protein [Pseudomonas oryzihabitans]|uniref:IclR family transcriptional regulator domain-containing protein n=1 Tax=Pseudomonas oryzihabitans TaxID=47885 RepID=UPI00123C5299|nr:IclR family transcriptional regulator C-terminal domain-containing protein [Pseudomonas oryzihabitans]QEU01961.1 helix-turn-helix domain-containing protein [Pseudomonas oryzihabitans]
MPNASSENAAFKASAATSSHGRLIEVLDALVRRADGDAWGVRELANDLGESRSTINRILVALVDRDFAVEDGVGKYALGPRFRVLMHALNNRSLLLNTARHLLDGLAETTKQAVFLSVYAPHLNGYYVLHYGEAPATLFFRPKSGNPFPLEFGDIGRAFSKFLRKHPSPDEVSPHQASIEPPRGISEFEFPPAVSTVVRQLAPGLLILVSLHDLGGIDAKVQDSAQVTLNQVADRLTQAVGVPGGIGLEVASDGDSSIVSRLEGLLQLVCAEPNGFTCKLGVAAQLQCNAATAKKIIGSASLERLIHIDGQVIYPGARLYQWAALLSNETYSPVKLCKAIIDSLVKETGETIAYLSFDGTTSKAQFLEVTQGWRPIQYKLETGVDVPLYAGGAGKAVLAHLPAHFAEGLNLEKLTDATISSHSKLRADLQLIRERGWSVGDGERVLGAFGIGVPFFIDGQIAGSISATIPQYRKEECDVPSLIESMKRASRRIGHLLSLGGAGRVVYRSEKEMPVTAIK